MPDVGSQLPAPPDGIRPGQLGVVLLQQVIIGDVAATLVDLSIRHLLQVEEPEPGDWLLGSAHASAPRYRRESLLSYERTLLDGLSRRGATATFASLAPDMPRVLEHTRAAVVHDAVHHGWLHHLHHDQRTDAGDQLASRLRAFQQAIRRAASEQGADVLTGPLLPYALHFGMIPADQHPLSRFAHDWVKAFSALPGWHLPEPRHYDPQRDDPVPTNDPGIHAGYWIP
jgi:hypothetical protein